MHTNQQSNTYKGEQINNVMHKPLSLRKNFSWIFIASIFDSACQYIILMVMSKLLPKEQVGFYALALYITTPIMMFSYLQLRSVLITDIANKYKFGDYFSVRILTNIISALIVIGILIYFGNKYSLTVKFVIFFVLVEKIIRAVSDVGFGVLQKHERLDKVSLSIIYKNILSIIFMTVVLLLTKNLLLAVVATGLGWLLLLFWYDKANINHFEQWRPRIHLENLMKITWLGLPLGIARGIIALDESVPGYFIEGTIGTENLAIFAVMSYTVTAAYRTVEAVGYSAAARLARYFVFNHKMYIMLLSKMVGIAALVGVIPVVAGIFFGKQILTILFKADYAQQPGIFVLLLIVAAGRMISSMLWHGITSAKKFKPQVPLSIAFLSVTFFGCLLLVPRYGMYGTALAMLLSVIVRIGGSIIIIIWALRNSLNPGTIIDDKSLVRADKNSCFEESQNCQKP